MLLTKDQADSIVRSLYNGLPNDVPIRRKRRSAYFYERFPSFKWDLPIFYKIMPESQFCEFFGMRWRNLYASMGEYTTDVNCQLRPALFVSRHAFHWLVSFWLTMRIGKFGWTDFNMQIIVNFIDGKFETYRLIAVSLLLQSKTFYFVIFKLNNSHLAF